MGIICKMMGRLLIILKGIRDFFASFLYTSSYKPQPAYFWATVFNGIAAWALIKHIQNTKVPSVELILGILVYVSGWIILYFRTKSSPPN